MGHTLMTGLYPIWIGIMLNIIFSVVNISFIGNLGKAADAWIKYSPWALGASWLVLIGIAVLNGVLVLT